MTPTEEIRMTEENENAPEIGIHTLPEGMAEVLFAALTGAAPEAGTRKANAFRDDAREEIAALWESVAAHVDDAYPKWMRQQMLNASFLSSLPDTVEGLMEAAFTLGQTEAREALEPRLVRAEQKLGALVEAMVEDAKRIRTLVEEKDQLRQALEAAQHAAGHVGTVDPVTRGLDEAVANNGMPRYSESESESEAPEPHDPPRSGALLD